MNSVPTIQRLAEGEEERLAHVRLAALKDAPWAFGTTYAEACGWGKDEWTGQLRTLPAFVAVSDGLDVGIVRGLRVHPPEDSAWLISMWVAAHARGQGVGGALVDAVIDWAAEERLSRVFLDVREGNRAARSLYLRKGFRDTGKRSPMLPTDDNVIECEMVRDTFRAPAANRSAS